MAPFKEYKLLTPRDPCFEGAFDLARPEAELNALARRGWVVKSMVTPHLDRLAGLPPEVLVVLPER
jgi:hypothetical protein